MVVNDKPIMELIHFDNSKHFSVSNLCYNGINIILTGNPDL